MAGSKTWRPLMLSGDGGLPPLLVAFETKASEYSIQVTDMAHVWTESMERKAICIRAWGENTSIDPSDTPENMGKFLQTLRSALNSTDSGSDEAMVTLSPGPLKNAGEDGLQLVATCPLPGFEALKWPFYLKKSSSVTLTNDFAIPLVENLYSKSRQVQMLIQALKQKDAVISKLADKLEATGTGLEHVFTALSGRKKVTREAADGKIRGLAPFDERKMQHDLQNDIDQPSDVMDLVQRVFDGKTPLSATSMNFKAGSEEGWWRGFSSTSSLPHRTGPTIEAQTAGPADTAVPSSPAEANDVTMGDENGDDGDDEFQVQSTPPRLKSKKETRSNDDAPSNQKPPSKAIKEEHKSSQEPKRVGRIGAIGGKKQVSPPSSPPKAASPSPPHPRTRAAAADDDETASETASDVDETASLPDQAAASSPPAAPSPPPARAAAKKSGLGRIGGKAKSSLHGDDTKPAADDAEEAKNEAKPAAAAAAAAAGPQKRLGVIGKRTGGAKDDDVQRGRTEGRGAPAEGAGGQRKEETSQERADRKREELKRELEKKAAAGPAKKKRRF